MRNQSTLEQIAEVEEIVNNPVKYRDADISDLPTSFLIEAAWELQAAMRQMTTSAPCLRAIKVRFEYENLKRNKKQ